MTPRKEAHHMTAVTSKGSPLGAAFAQQVFSVDEKTRLGKLLVEGGVAARVIKKYVVHTPAYRDGFRKREKIAGFRQATPAFDKQAIPLIIRYLGDSTDE